MNGIYLFPRLSPAGLQLVLTDLEPLKNGLLEEIRRTAEPYVSWTASGGTRIGPSGLTEFRNEILDIARAQGFPEPPAQARRSAFDAKCSIYLANQQQLPVCEALRDDVWTFLSACLLPDVVLWRFPSAPTERFRGGIRNVFQRLWLRGQIFDRSAEHPDRWELLDILSEDAMVQITERPSIGADAELASAIAEVWLRVSNEVGINRMEGLTRRAIRNIRIINVTRNLAALDRNALEAAIGQCFYEAAKA